MSIKRMKQCKEENLLKPTAVGNLGIIAVPTILSTEQGGRELMIV
jgi:hypothetical protein